MEKLTDRQKQLIVNNIVASCRDINKLSKTSYKWLSLCSGFIAHYDIHGFKSVYSERDLTSDIKLNGMCNQWLNFRQGEKDFEYYQQKAEIYNAILERI